MGKRLEHGKRLAQNEPYRPNWKASVDGEVDAQGTRLTVTHHGRQALRIWSVRALTTIWSPRAFGPAGATSSTSSVREELSGTVNSHDQPSLCADFLFAHALMYLNGRGPERAGERALHLGSPLLASAAHLAHSVSGAEAGAMLDACVSLVLAEGPNQAPTPVSWPDETDPVPGSVAAAGRALMNAIARFAGMGLSSLTTRIEDRPPSYRHPVRRHGAVRGRPSWSRDSRTGARDRDPCGRSAGVKPRGGSLGPRRSEPQRRRRWADAAVIAAFLAALPDPSHAAERANVLPLVMRTPHGGFNRLLVSVTVCEPGTERCATIDDVMIDTGSTGLRLEASAVPAWLWLPAFPGPGGRPLAECLRFVHDTAWGPLHRADVRLGGLTAKGLPLQVIDDLGGPQPPACPRSDVPPTSNGTLGVGQHLYDCQGACEQRAGAPGVFVQDGAFWSPVEGAIEPAYRLPNPVSYLPGHDNGIVIELPAPPAGSAREVAGTLTFGVDAVAGDGAGTASILHLDAAGRFTTVLDGRSYPASYIDSGTETYILRDDSLPRCRDMAWAYCVEPRRTLDAEMVGIDGKRIPMNFGVGNYQSVRERHAGASDDVAEAAELQSDAVVWGAPFFLGRRVSLVMDGRSVPGISGLLGPCYILD